MLFGCAKKINIENGWTWSICRLIKWQSFLEKKEPFYDQKKKWIEYGHWKWFSHYSLALVRNSNLTSWQARSKWKCWRKRDRMSFSRSVFTEKCASSKVQMACLILLYRTRSWLTNLPPKSLSQCLAYVIAHSRKFCTNERRCGIPSFVGIMSYYWLELTTRADGITTVVTFWHARYLHTQHHKNSTPPNAYSISYITSAQHSKLGYFWLCVALSLSEALLFFKSFASYFNHYICSFKCENKCIAALKNDGQDKSAWKKIAFFAWEKPFFMMKLRTYLKHVVRNIRHCFKIMEEMVECQKWITFNNRKVEFK